MNIEEELILIQKAKIKYPPGTKVSNYNLKYDCRFKITGIEFRRSTITPTALLVDSNSTQDAGAYTVYDEGKWADILESPVPKELPIFN